MRPLKYSINVTLDGCCDHREGIPDAALHARAARTVGSADALIFGRVIYQMMESAWREPAETGIRPDWMPEWGMAFAETIHRMPKYVASDTLESVDWNAQLVRSADLEATVRNLKNQPGNGLLAGGVALPLALARMGLIDEYDFVVHPRIAGHGPWLLAGLERPLTLELVGREDLTAGVYATTYRPRPN